MPMPEGASPGGGRVVSGAEMHVGPRRSSRGVREPFVPPGQRPIARSPLTPLLFRGAAVSVELRFRSIRGFRRRGAGGADGSLARNRRHSIGMSEPDVPPGQQRREGGEDFAFLTTIWVSRPLPLAKWILGLFRVPFFSKTWADSPLLRQAVEASSRINNRTASPLEIAGKSELDPAPQRRFWRAAAAWAQTCQVLSPARPSRPVGQDRGWQRPGCAAARQWGGNPGRAPVRTSRACKAHGIFRPWSVFQDGRRD
jgi:hypothetical protein